MQTASATRDVFNGNPVGPSKVQHSHRQASRSFERSSDTVWGHWCGIFEESWSSVSWHLLVPQSSKRQAVWNRRTDLPDCMQWNQFSSRWANLRRISMHDKRKDILIILYSTQYSYCIKSITQHWIIQNRGSTPDTKQQC
jgi:hypothetical protein